MKPNESQLIALQTESLSLGDLALLTALSSSVFIVCEGKKLIERYSIREIKSFVSSRSSSVAGLRRRGSKDKNKGDPEGAHLV